MSDDPTPTRKPPGTPAKPIGLGFVVIGSELATSTLSGVAVDYFAKTGGVFTVVMTLLGMVAAVLLAVRLLKDESKGTPG